jgi:hypothetical protein
MSTPFVRAAVAVIVLSLAALEANAGTGCDAGLTVPLQGALRLVRSMHGDKPGQARVFAADGQEFTAGTARWMSAELEIARRACARGDSATASVHVDAVRNLLQAHSPAH